MAGGWARGFHHHTRRESRPRFKDREALFEIWESDSGRGQLFGPGDDDVDELKADILGNHSERGWTATFAEEPELPYNNAELYFKVSIEDRSCTSNELFVPSTIRFP